MNLPPLLPISEIQKRLLAIFPEGLEHRKYLTRDMAARTVFVFLYGAMIEGGERRLRPSHVYRFTHDQAEATSDEERVLWASLAGKNGYKPIGERWYADNTREPIRDETIRTGLLDIGAVGKLESGSTTASTPIYFLRSDFVALFDPAHTEETFKSACEAWQTRHLSVAARARVRIISAGRTKREFEVAVTCPDGTVVKLGAGLSSQISKAVVEEFAPSFMASPVLLWLSESGNKARHSDVSTASALGLNINVSKVLPDIILANLGTSGADTYLVFIEVVATDGPMHELRKTQLLTYVEESGFPTEQCYFGTAFEDRSSGAFRKALPTLAWGTFGWFRSEPTRLMVLFERPFGLNEI